MQAEELFTIRVGLLISCLYSPDDAREPVSQPTELVFLQISMKMSLLHHFEHVVSKSPVMTETRRSSLLMLSIRKSKFVQKFSNSC